MCVVMRVIMMIVGVIVRSGHFYSFSLLSFDRSGKSNVITIKAKEPLAAFRVADMKIFIEQEVQMGSTADKIKGTANDAIGQVKEGIGKAVDSDKLQAEGLAQQAKGHGQKAVGEAKEAAKDAADKVAEFANKKL